jgi:thiol-disulfide isomerase/thioredoxin
LQGGKTNALLDSFRSTLSRNASKMENKSVAEKKQFYIEALSEFLRQHPNEMASLILIEQANPGLSQHDLTSFYESLDANLKSGYYGIRLKAAIDKNNKAVVQMPIKEFAQADLNGKPISISSLRGKYVLIDFWASWCIPCRQENPNLSRIYQQYKIKGFEILGVSLDTDHKSWLTAVEQDKLKWLHVSDLQGLKNEIAVMFKIDAIPDNILIDREGRIMAKKITSRELEQILDEAL